MFNSKDDAEHRKFIASCLSHKDVTEAVWKHTLIEIAVRLETGAYAVPHQAAQERQPLPPEAATRIVNEAAHGIGDDK